MTASEHYAIPIRLTPQFYVDYAMTETNVATAISKGAPEEEVRDWCRQTVFPTFDGAPRDVIFRGYIAYMSRC